MKLTTLHFLFFLLAATVMGCKKNSNQRNNNETEYIKIDGKMYDLNKYAHRYSEDTFTLDRDHYAYEYYGLNGDDPNLNGVGNEYNWEFGAYFKSSNGTISTRNLASLSDWDSNPATLNNSNCVIYFGFWAYNNGVFNTDNNNLVGNVYYYSKANGTCTVADGYIHFSGVFDVLDDGDVPGFSYSGQANIEANLKYNR